MSDPHPPRPARAALCLLAAAAVWLPAMHLGFRPRLEDWRLTPGTATLPPRLAELTEAQIRVWRQGTSLPPDLARMRRINPEWDFMGRTYLVLGLAGQALAVPGLREGHLEVIDAILRDTLDTDTREGLYHFLMPYARTGRWVVDPPHSVFVDGEIALMLGARRLVEESQEWAEEMDRRLAVAEAAMRQSPVLCAESYPNECWMFCNSIAVAAMAMAEALKPAGREAFIAAWLGRIRDTLVDPATGLLLSSFGVDGALDQGPEGSSIWMAAHMISLVDPEFGQDQYDRARREMGRSLLGFGYATEWPPSGPLRPDVDSGAVLPVLQLSPASSGLAFVAAGGFGDERWLRQLLTSLRYGGFPTRREGGLRFQASNSVGDAVLLYGLSAAPLRDAVQARRRPTLAGGAR